MIWNQNSFWNFLSIDCDQRSQLTWTERNLVVDSSRLRLNSSSLFWFCRAAEMSKILIVHEKLNELIGQLLSGSQLKVKGTNIQWQTCVVEIVTNCCPSSVKPRPPSCPTLWSHRQTRRLSSFSPWTSVMDMTHAFKSSSHLILSVLWA